MSDHQQPRLQTAMLPTLTGANSFLRLSRLYDIVRSLASIRRLDSLLYQIVASAADMLDAKGSALLLLDASGGNLKVEVTSGRDTAPFKSTVLAVDDRSVEGTVVLHGTSRIENMIAYSSYLYGQAGQLVERKAKKLVCVPLKVQARIIGALQVLDKINGADFNVDDLKLLEALADTASVAIENVRLYEEERRQGRLAAEAYNELQKTYKATVRALTGLLDARDEVTHGHSMRVVQFTLRLAAEIGITDPARLRKIEQGALLHDIGKVGVRDAILRKAGTLDEDEWAEMREHPEIGYQMLRDVEFLREALVIVRFHHERWDGSGYPFGLKGDQTPIEARIFAIADTFDAITSERPYKSSRTYEEAAETFLQERGKLFDPDLVDAFLRIPEHEWEIMRDVAVSGQLPLLTIAFKTDIFKTGHI